MKKDCKNCQEPFEAKRSTAEFCSTNCRVKCNNKNGGTEEKKSSPQKVTLTDLNEKIDIKPITKVPAKTNYTVNTSKPNNQSLKSILSGLGYNAASERKPYIPKVK